MKLTLSLLKSVRHPGGPRKRWHVLFDDGSPGLGFRVYESGKKAWVFRYVTREGRKRLITLGRFPKMGLDEARAVADRHRRAVEAGRDPLEEQHGLAHEVTMSELLREYLERYAEPRKKTAASDAARFRRHVLPHWENRKASTITRADVASLHSLIGRKSGQYEANRTLENLAVVFRVGELWGLLPDGHRNPCTGVEAFRERSRDRWLTPDEVASLAHAIDAETATTIGPAGTLSDRLVRHCESLSTATTMKTSEACVLIDRPANHTVSILASLVARGRLRKLGRGRYALGPNPWPPDDDAQFLRGALWLYLLTGLRKGELLGARWVDVDLRRETLTIPETKNGRGYVVPLSAPAVAILRDLPRRPGNPYLLPGRKKGAHLVNLDKAWHRVCERAGIQNARLHDLRRTVGSWLAQAGNSLLVIQKALNHSSYAATLVYARLGNDQVRTAMDEHGQRIMDAAGRGTKTGEVLDLGVRRR